MFQVRCPKISIFNYLLIYKIFFLFLEKNYPELNWIEYSPEIAFPFAYRFKQSGFFHQSVSVEFNHENSCPFQHFVRSHRMNSFFSLFLYNALKIANINPLPNFNAFFILALSIGLFNKLEHKKTTTTQEKQHSNVRMYPNQYLLIWFYIFQRLYFLGWCGFSGVGWLVGCVNVKKLSNLFRQFSICSMLDEY